MRQRQESTMGFRISAIAADRVAVVNPATGDEDRIAKWARCGDWTLMATVTGGKGQPVAVFENLRDECGSIVFATEKGTVLELGKSLESTAPQRSAEQADSIDRALGTQRDVLAEELLARGDDPAYEEVAARLPPIARAHDLESGCEKIVTFVGSPDSLDKAGVFYGGRCANLDPAAFSPEIAEAVARGEVREGLVGGWLPVLRFVYPAWADARWELIVFGSANPPSIWRQPVWYRLVRIADGTVGKLLYFNSYITSTGEENEPGFYRGLAQLARRWKAALRPAMKVALSEPRIADFCRHSLARAAITRVGSHPKYGVFDRHYGGTEHDGFPDTFTANASAQLEWGLFKDAQTSVESYLTDFVRDDGALAYRGPETGQYGRILSVLAQYFEYTGDSSVLAKHSRRIEGIENLLLGLRREAEQLPRESASFGMIRGWSEADSCLSSDPDRFKAPYFSNSTEAARGLSGIGRAWKEIGMRAPQPELARRGERLIDESRALRRDVLAQVERSLLRTATPACLPSIAGAGRPFDEEIRDDPSSPQQFAARAYCEMLHSGILPAWAVETITKYNASHGGSLLGIPGFSGGAWLGGSSGRNRTFLTFLAHRYAYGLVQHDRVREFLLLYYSLMAHGYTRGTWSAFEFCAFDPTGKRSLASYCVPAQLSIPLLTRWMLVFEDPDSPMVRLAYAIPRRWLEDGKTIAVRAAPTRWGRIGFQIRSTLSRNSISAVLRLPSDFAAGIVLRLRAPGRRRLASVTVRGEGGQPIRSSFDPAKEQIVLEAPVCGRVSVQARYE